MINRAVSCRVKAIALVVIVCFGGVSHGIAADTVVVYSALDQQFSQPLLRSA